MSMIKSTVGETKWQKIFLAMAEGHWDNPNIHKR